MTALPTLSPAALVRRHFATNEEPLPDPSPLAWIEAANGTFKRGRTADVEVLLQVDRRRSPVPGLAALLPHVRWPTWPGRLPGDLLVPLLEDARRAHSGGTIARPIEKGYFLIWRDGTVRLIAPPQQGTAAHLQYAMPQRGAVLADLHSHHEMSAYFSDRDNRDDRGVGVSIVIGTIFTDPQIICRLNVYGHHQLVPARMLFDHLGPFRDALDDIRALEVAHAEARG